MKRWRIFIRQKALDDTSEIYAYLAQDNPPAADAFLDALDQAAILLSETPEIGSPRYFDHPELQGLRFCSLKRYENYLIFYRILGTGQALEIVRLCMAHETCQRCLAKKSKSSR